LNKPIKARTWLGSKLDIWARSSPIEIFGSRKCKIGANVKLWVVGSLWRTSNSSEADSQMWFCCRWW